MKRTLIVLLTLGALLLGGAGGQAASGATVSGSVSQAGITGVRYRITDLGTLGGSFSGPLDVNARGEVTGFTADASESALIAFRWSRGRMSPLPSLGGPNEVGDGINDAGHIDGWSQITTPAPPSLFNQTSIFCTSPFVEGQPLLACHATLWRRHGAPIDLGTLGGLNSTAQNKGINNRDQVVGAAETTQLDPTGLPGALRFHAFVWQRGRMTDLGTLGSDPDSYAISINDHNEIVGVSIPDAAGFNGNNGRAFVWRHGRIHALRGLGGTRSYALAIDNRGDIVGAATLPGDPARHAVLWIHGRPTDLGTLPGDVSSEATDLLSKDLIVGTSCVRGECRATLWRHGHAIDLNTLIPASSGWHLDDVQAVNHRGQIVGDGTHHGNARAFLLTPTCTRT